LSNAVNPNEIHRMELKSEIILSAETAKVDQKQQRCKKKKIPFAVTPSKF
jgi:hypothetical protein